MEVSVSGVMEKVVIEFWVYLLNCKKLMYLLIT